MCRGRPQRRPRKSLFVRQSAAESTRCIRHQSEIASPHSRPESSDGSRGGWNTANAVSLSSSKKSGPSLPAEVAATVVWSMRVPRHLPRLGCGLFTSGLPAPPLGRSALLNETGQAKPVHSVTAHHVSVAGHGRIRSSPRGGVLEAAQAAHPRPDPCPCLAEALLSAPRSGVTRFGDREAMQLAARRSRLRRDSKTLPFRRHSDLYRFAEKPSRRSHAVLRAGVDTAWDPVARNGRGVTAGSDRRSQEARCAESRMQRR